MELAMRIHQMIQVAQAHLRENEAQLIQAIKDDDTEAIEHFNDAFSYDQGYLFALNEVLKMLR